MELDQCRIRLPYGVMAEFTELSGIDSEYRCGWVRAYGMDIIHTSDETGIGRDFRPVTGRPATGRSIVITVFFFHIKLYKTSTRSQEYLSENI